MKGLDAFGKVSEYLDTDVWSDSHPRQCLDYGGRESQDEDWCILYVVEVLSAGSASDLKCTVTILSAAIIFAITTMEFFDYRRVNLDTSIAVDKSRGEKLIVNFNVTFPRVPCYRKCSSPSSLPQPNPTDASQ